MLNIRASIKNSLYSNYLLSSSPVTIGDDSGQHDASSNRAFPASRMLNEIRDHNDPPAYDVFYTEPIGISQTKVRELKYIPVAKRSSATICCSIWAINRISEILAGRTILLPLTVRFPLMNSNGFSFSELFTCPEVHEYLSFTTISTYTTNSNHHQWSLALFSTFPPGVYWVQFDLKPGLGDAYKHVVVVQILQAYEKILIAQDQIAIIQDNAGGIGIVQKGDIDDAVAKQSGDSIFQRFLEIDYKVETVIQLHRRIRKDSAYAVFSQVNDVIKDRRSTRNMHNSIIARINTKPAAPQHCQCSPPTRKFAHRGIRRCLSYFQTTLDRSEIDAPSPSCVSISVDTPTAMLSVPSAHNLDILDLSSDDEDDHKFPKKKEKKLSITNFT